MKNLNNKALIEQILSSPPQKPSLDGRDDDGELDLLKVQKLAESVQLSIGEISQRLQSMKHTLVEQDVSYAEMITAIHLLRILLLALQCVDQDAASTSQ